MKVVNLIFLFKVLFLLFLSFSILCSCTLINQRNDLGPIAGNGWQVNTAPSTLSGWKILDISTSNNNYTQANFKCEGYTLYLNSILDKSYSISAIPPIPVYIKTNDKMSLFILPDDKQSTLVSSIQDCPNLFSLSHEADDLKKSELNKTSGDKNLCQYEFKNSELDLDHFKLSMLDKKNKCEIDNLAFMKTSNWTFCLYCFFNVATQPVYNYQPLNGEDELVDSNSSDEDSTITINSHASTGVRLGATTLGAIVGGAAGLLLASEQCRSPDNKCKWSALGGLFFGIYTGGIIGISLAEDRTGANVNIIYPF